MRFNPSSNPYTERISSTLQSLALEEWQLERKKKLASDILKQLSSGGLIQEAGAMEGSGGNPNSIQAGGLLGQSNMGPAFVSGIDLETGMPKISFQSPKDLEETRLLKEIKNNPQYRNKGVSIGGQTFERIPTKEEKEQDIADEANKKSVVKAEEERVVNASKMERLGSIVDVIEQEYKKTKTPGGLSGFIRRPIETFGRHLQLTPNQRTDSAYGSFVKGIKAQLARGLGEVGNLAKNEQEDAMNLVPTLLDDPDTATKKLTALRELINRIKSRAGKSFISPATGNNSSSGFVRKGTLPDGTRVGMKADGTVEVINAE